MAVAPTASDTPNRAAPRGPDILTRTAPPLSARTDMPLVGTEQPPTSASNSAADHASGVPAEMTPEQQAAAHTAKTADPAQQAAATEPAPSADPAPAAETAPDPDTADLAKDLPGYAVREITKARKQARAQIEAITAKAAKDAEALAALQKTVGELTARVNPPQPADIVPAQEPRPKREDFESPEQHDDAMAAWGIKEGSRLAAAEAAKAKADADKRSAEEAAAAKRTAVEAENARLNADWATKKAAAIEKIPDLDAVISADDVLNVSQAAAHAILIVPNGPEVAYHLAKNPELVASLNAMPNAVAQLIEIGRLSAQIAAPPPPRRAPTPRPLEPLNGGGNPADTSAREPSMEEWASKRTPEILGVRKAFVMPSDARH